jgi:4-hydroxybutyrate dehydrogenase
MDALSHCIETYLSPRVNPPADAIALDGAGRLWRHLERAVADGSDREARWQTMMGALEGGLTFQKGLGAVHGLSHALGGLKEPNLHHGLLNAVLLPPVLRHNRGHVGDRYERLAQAVGLPPGSDLAQAVEALNERIGLPNSLAGLGLTEAVVRPVAERAQADHSTATNPRPMSVEAYEGLLRAALS